MSAAIEHTTVAHAPEAEAVVAPPDVAVSVIIPTRNESGNITTLIARLDSALAETQAEVIFVDDSDDDTPAVIETTGRLAGIPVHLMHRASPDRGGGLGSAVVAGLQAARGRWAVVMDGDLQHPPERVLELLAAGSAHNADVVVASRYVADGDESGLSGPTRRWVSRGATTLAQWMFPRRLRGCTDPMSGFFALRLAGIDVAALHPNGFKILLEILTRCPGLRVTEVPFVFGERLSGTSKASLREGVRYVARLTALRWAAWRRPWLAWAATMVGFGLVGVSGIVVNSVALWAFFDGLHLPLLVAAALATQVSTTWNFVLTDQVVFRGPKKRSVWPRLLGFAVMNNAVLLARLPFLYWLVHTPAMGYLAANAVTLVAAFAVRFVLSDRLLFTRRDSDMTTLQTPPRIARRQGEGAMAAATPPPTEPHRVGPVDTVVDLRPNAHAAVTVRDEPLCWHYSIHDLVRIDSVVRLSELDTFAVDAGRPGGPADIEIRCGVIGDGHPRRRTRVTQYAASPIVQYQEQIGRHGCDFQIDMECQPYRARGTAQRSDGHDTSPIRVTVGPLLVHSPHVLYVNVIEALLRFVLVSHEHILLHSACLDIDGRGLMLSALTDTGKTGTILRLLRETRARFLSDDMTVLDRTGLALAYPKPMTISQHTLRAVNAGNLSRAEWRRLRVQSRLHSKQGRAIGARMGEMNLPILSVNALTQLLVPPPKYEANRLVPCTFARSVHISDLFIIARGEPNLADITDTETLVDELIANTDDAYGFPPFRYFAPALVIAGLGYEELRARERRILTDAIAGVSARRLVTPDFTWADRIPPLLSPAGRAAAVRPRDTLPPDLSTAHAAAGAEPAASR